MKSEFWDWFVFRVVKDLFEYFLIVVFENCLEVDIEYLECFIENNGFNEV